ncbi:MAG TPA: DUF1659 domain-containing protein [bacterium]|nr:DUF1659 domain-containing protein [bacterium]
MPVISTPVADSVRITFVVDEDVEGNPISPPVKRTRSYGPISPSATDQDVWDFATALIALQEYNAETIERVKTFELIGA